MQKRSKYLFKNVSILAISKFSSKLLIFLLIPLYTSVLSTKEYGIYDLIISTIQLVFPIITLNIVDGVMRYSMEKNVDKRECATIGLKYILLSFAIILIFLLFSKIFLPIKQIKGLEIIIFFYFVLYSLNEYFIQLSKGLEYVKALGIAGVLGTIITIIFTFLFLITFKFGLKGFILANVLGLLIQVIYYIFKIKYWNLVDFKTNNKILKKEMLLYSIPLIVTVVGWWINNAADKYAVSMMCGLAATGLLSIAAKDFNQAWLYVPFLLVSSTFNTASGFLGPILTAEKKSKEMAKSALYGTIINIISNIILIKLIGLQGATIATAISSFVIYYVRKKEVGKKIYIEKYSKVLLLWILLIIESLFEIYSSLYLIEILIFVSIIFLNRDKVKNIIIQIKCILK